jgi:hypothetical protein
MGNPLNLFILWWPENGSVDVNPNSGRRVLHALDEFQRSKALMCVLQFSIPPAAVASYSPVSSSQRWAGERNSQRTGLPGLGSSILREKREAQLPLTDIAKVVLLSAPDLVITAGFLDRWTLAVHPALRLDL